MDIAQSPLTVTEGQLVKAIAASCYSVEPQVERLARYNNAVYRLRFPSASKILKLAKNPDKASIRKELMLITLLRKHGIPVPHVEHYDEIGTSHGRPFFVMDSAGDQTVAECIGNPGETGRRLFTEMGAVLARIHDVTFPASGDIRHDGVVPADPRDYLAKLYRTADWAVAEGLLEPSEASLFKSLTMPLTGGVQLCHSDFHAVQCIVRDGRISAVVDWESAWAGNAGVDIAITHAYLDYYCPADLIRCFVDGYTTSRALPPDYDEAYLPVRMALPLSLLRVWHGQGSRSWQYALKQRRVERAVELYRTYARRILH